MLHFNRRPVLVAGFTAVLLFGAVACGSNNDDAKPSDNNDSVPSAEGKLTVCSDIPYKPMEFEGPGPRGLKYTGFDIDLLDAMAQTMGDKLAVIDVDFDGILGNLSTGTCDVVGSSLTINAERKTQVDFTKAYFDADQSLLVKTDSGIKSLGDLAGKTIGVQSKTTGETYANKNTPAGATIKSFDDTDGLFGALESGDIKGILQDLPVNAGRVADDPSVQVAETFKTDEQYGFAVEKGSDLRAKLDTALEAVHSDGTYDKLYNKYFPKAG